MVAAVLHRFKPVRLAFMTADLIRGHIETVILANLLREDTYGYEINKRVLALTDNRYDLKEATLYSAFRRLESAGLVSSYWGTEESGSRRRYYKITDEGKKVYWSRKVDWDKAKEIIDKLIKEV
ncbi:PadR family transcriptional regulator [Planctomycetales bacterium]|nr:PadR family transcriptional regulator [Planctomycetales bacterium]GHT37835.1 PadR family transcriptional regulator [Planctomycetales bacterium]